MNSSLILSNISKHINLETKEKDFFISLLQSKVIQKKAPLLSEDQICKQLTFVNSGTLRAFYLSKDGKETTVMFAINDWWITDMYAYKNGLPAMLNIEAVEQTEVLQLSKDNFETLLDQVPKFEKFFRIIFQNAYIREQLRSIQNLSRTAEERYHHFVDKYPLICQKVKQKQIASYLGITPEFLSVLRARRKFNQNDKI